MQAGERTANKVAQKWEECPGRRARAGAPGCTRAPESLSRLSAQQWDAVSVSRPSRKAHPAISRNSGPCFPKQARSGKRVPLWIKIPGRIFRRGIHKRKGPLCRGPSQFKVAGKGIAPALRACGPLRRSRALRAPLANAIAFPQLRALTGFDSVRGPQKRKGPLCRGPSQFKVAGKGIEPLTRGFSVLCSTN